VTAETYFPTLDDLLAIGRKLLGDNLPIRDIGLLESAVARPRATVFGDLEPMGDPIQFAIEDLSLEEEDAFFAIIEDL